MTHDEAMRRLLACHALKRGERGACASPVRVPHSVVHHWATLVSSSVVLGGKIFTGFGAVERSRAEWRRLAAPLRRAREERRGWKKMALTLGNLIKQMQDQAEEERCEIVGAALLAFFTDLSVLVRTTPAPCPWCGDTPEHKHDEGAARHGYDVNRWVYCYGCSSEGPTRGDDEYGDKSALRAWNRVAVPAAYARLGGG